MLPEAVWTSSPPPSTAFSANRLLWRAASIRASLGLSLANGDGRSLTSTAGGVGGRRPGEYEAVHPSGPLDVVGRDRRDRVRVVPTGHDQRGREPHEVGLLVLQRRECRVHPGTLVDVHGHRVSDVRLECAHLTCLASASNGTPKPTWALATGCVISTCGMAGHSSFGRPPGSAGLLVSGRVSQVVGQPGWGVVPSIRWSQSWSGCRPCW